MKIFPYHQIAAEILREELADLWQHFDGDSYLAEQASRVRLDLLRHTQALDGEHGRILDLGQRAAEALGVADVPVLIHQRQDGEDSAPRLCFMPDEIHLVVSPRILTALTDHQVCCVLAHEMAHHQLWTVEEGQFRTAEVVAAALAASSEQEVALRTERNVRQLTEIACDIASLAVVSKIEDFAGALAEFDELAEWSEQSSTSVDRGDERPWFRELDALIHADAPPPNRGGSHPSSAFRCWAAQQWLTDGSECLERLQWAVLGQFSLESLCLVRQRQLYDWTQAFLTRFTSPDWIRTESIRKHVELFQAGDASESDQPLAQLDQATETVNSVGGDIGWEALAEELSAITDEGTRDYFAYLTLDCITADRALEPFPLVWALDFWERIGWAGHVADVLGRELKVGKRKMKQLFKDREEILTTAPGRSGS